MRSTDIVCNIGGEAILSEYFYIKYFPDYANCEKKKIWKPLFIGLAICTLFIFFAVWAKSQVMQ